MAAGMLGIHSSWGCLKQHGHPDIQGNDVTSLICHEMAYLQSIVPMIGTTYCYKRIRTLIYTFLPVECIVTFILTFFIVFLMTLCLDYRQHRVAKNEPPNCIIYSITRTSDGLWLMRRPPSGKGLLTYFVRIILIDWSLLLPIFWHVMWFIYRCGLI